MKRGGDWRGGGVGGVGRGQGLYEEEKEEEKEEVCIIFLSKLKIVKSCRDKLDDRRISLFVCLSYKQYS